MLDKVICLAGWLRLLNCFVPGPGWLSTPGGQTFCSASPARPSSLSSTTTEPAPRTPSSRLTEVDGLIGLLGDPLATAARDLQETPAAVEVLPAAKAGELPDIPEAGELQADVEVVVQAADKEVEVQAADKEVEVQAAADSSKETEGGGLHYLLHPVHHYHLLGAWEARQGSQKGWGFIPVIFWCYLEINVFDWKDPMHPLCDTRFQGIHFELNYKEPRLWTP